MTLLITKEHLSQLLKDKDNKVIALSGKWGTGKSHLWEEIKAESKDEAVRAALYISLFGLRDMNQVKMKMVQSALPNADRNSASLEKVRLGLESARKVLYSLHKGFSALDEIALLAVPSLLKGKVIVLDDVERKHAKLCIDEILGFIDEFTQQHGARFVMILNSDQLVDQEDWDKFREKVVDQEIRLNTSTSEAFDIAVTLTTTPYAATIRRAVVRCGLTNIRIIRKVIKATNRILGNRLDLSEPLLLRVVPSTVLLSAIHYKGMEDGPNFDFVLSRSVQREWAALFASESDKPADEEEGRVQARWRALLGDLGIHACDEFEVLVVEFLKSGLFDSVALTRIVDRLAWETEKMATLENFKQLADRIIWNHPLTGAELIDEARGLLPSIHLLDAYHITAFHDVVEPLPGGAALAKEAVGIWLTSFRARNIGDIDEENSFGHKVHPMIQAELDSLRSKAQAKLTVFDVCEHMVKNDGWGECQRLVMQNASTADFEAAIRTLDIESLKLFMRKMMELTVEPGGAKDRFGSATSRFCEACKNISDTPDSGRLGELIKTLFTSYSLNLRLVYPHKLT